MGGGSPPTPQVQAPLPAAPAPPQLPNTQVQQAGMTAQRQAAAAAGVNSTIITGPQGLVGDNSNQTATKQLTGQ